MTKQHILQEIKRIALANGGKAFGRDRFYNETGIRESDWFGKYWPRWSDAIREAGLVPNQMQVSYEENFLIEKLIGLAREIGHFPVKGDFRLKSYNEKGFPNDRTFGRLGSKNQLASKVAEYCRQRSGFDDVLRMCETASPKIESDKAPEEKSESVEKIGIVYLIKSGKFYKIGETNSIGRREYDLAIQLAEKPTTIHVIKTDDPDGIEAYWHRRFAGKRKGGEWFDLKASDIKAFKKWLRIV
jgi:hypothetical protein